MFWILLFPSSLMTCPSKHLPWAQVSGSHSEERAQWSPFDPEGPPLTQAPSRSAASPGLSCCAHQSSAGCPTSPPCFSPESGSEGAVAYSTLSCGHVWSARSGQWFRTPPTGLRARTLARPLSPPALGASEGQSGLLWTSPSHGTRGVQHCLC